VLRTVSEAAADSGSVGMKIIRQAAKFGTVGLINTGLTLAIIYLMGNALHIPYLIANGIGYMAGFINSFVWNQAWTFRASDTGHTASHFLVVGQFGVNIASMIDQLGHAWTVNMKLTHYPFSGVLFHFWDII
jgi:putative flippase GtrA